MAVSPAAIGPYWPSTFAKAMASTAQKPCFTCAALPYLGNKTSFFRPLCGSFKCRQSASESSMVAPFVA